jgi:hypothetical protein
MMVSEEIEGRVGKRERGFGGVANLLIRNGEWEGAN